MVMMGSGAGGRALISLSFSSNFLSSSLLSSSKIPSFPRISHGHFNLSKPVCISTISTTKNDPQQESKPAHHSLLLEKLRTRHLKDTTKKQSSSSSSNDSNGVVLRSKKGAEMKKIGGEKVKACGSFSELGLKEELMEALKEMGISVPSEIQCVGIPAVLVGKSVVLGSHTGSGKTLTYMLPLVQLIKRDEEASGMLMKARRPRAVVMCPTRELSEQVFRVAKSISHHARFRSTMISGGGRLRPQEDSLNVPLDMIVGTPGRILQHINDGNIVYGDIKYLVLDEADTMFDRGFGPDIRKFLAPLKNRCSKAGDHGFQTILVAATMTKAVQTLIDEEFQGIEHVRTSTFNKKVASARHDFMKLSGTENKLEVLLQVLEPSLAKGNRVMVFCNTLNSSRAVDHFLGENQIFTVNYHGEVPAEQRVENLKKFKSDEGDCPTLVCTDLAARGLDMDVDHVIMFDFPLNSIDYLHRTGRTARMGAKGKVTSLVAKKDLILATRIEDAIQKNESLETLNVDSVRRDRPNKPDPSSSSKSRPNKSSQPASRSGGSKSGPTRSNRSSTGGKMGKSAVVSDRNSRPMKKVAVVKAFDGGKSKAIDRRKKTTVAPKTGMAAGAKIKVVGFRRSSATVNGGAPAR